MMSEREKAWAKENGLKKSGLVTYECGRWLNVYRAKDGKLYFRLANVYHLTYENYCEEA